MSQQLEVWQRGPLPEIIPMLQPVAHALLQAREEINEYMYEFPKELLWERPAGMASTGFHLQHLSGVLDRVFTYARAEGLSEFQFSQLYEEGKDAEEGYSVEALVDRFNNQVDLAMQQLKDTDGSILADYRGIGRAGLPSTVIGLLFHAAEHTMRHVGQLMVTAAVVKNYRP
ncbi:DinB family protein [Pedobacter metabolipauper]|uniref:DinB family protein n=1 Tax=Pedobacter metabolipauper TaxID=425513 RepID=A0A4R6SV24_9SPHI|nr:DinB family protein [Pedobacter metabolipauper]TDQ08896.1 DinB family protein [Pedobacter metabolipauper]